MGVDLIFKDRRKGPACLINKRDAYVTYGADLKELAPIQSNVITNYRKATGNSKINNIHHEFDTPNLQATFYVTGRTFEECTINTSNLIMSMSECILRTLDNDFEYSCILTNYIVNETGIDFYNEVIVNLAAIRRLPKEVFIPKSNNEIFINKGTTESGMRITIHALSEISNLVVCGIKIDNIQANKYFIIDGIEGNVFNDGQSALLQTDLIDFPKVKNGANKFTISSMTNVEVTIEYYPTFLY